VSPEDKQAVMRLRAGLFSDEEALAHIQAMHDVADCLTEARTEIDALRKRVAELEAERDRMRRDLVESEQVSEQRHESAVRWMNDANRSRRILADIDAASARAERAEAERDEARRMWAEQHIDSSPDDHYPHQAVARQWGAEEATRLYPGGAEAWDALLYPRDDEGQT